MKKIFLLLIFIWTYPIVINASKTLESLLEEANHSLYTNPQYSIQCADRITSSSKDSLLITQAYLIKGLAEKYLGNFDLSFTSFHKAETSCPQDERVLYAIVRLHVSDIYSRLMDYNKAIKLNNEATSILKMQNDSTGLAIAYNSRGIIHYNLEEFRTAEDCFMKALHINRKLGNIKAISANLNNMCLYKGDLEDKLNKINEAIIINKNLNAQLTLAENYNNKGKQYYFAGQYEKAIAPLNIAKEIAWSFDAKELICDNYEYFSLVYFGMKDYKKAYENLEQLHILSSKLQTTNRLRIIEKQISEGIITEQQKEIDQKENQYKIKVLERNLAILSVVFFVIIILLIVIPYLRKRKKDLEVAEAQYRLEQSEREVAELKIQQQQDAIKLIETQLDTMHHEVTNFAMYLYSRNQLLDSISKRIKEGYKMELSELQVHLKKINYFIAQYKRGTKETNELLEKIEIRNKDFKKRILELHPNLTTGEINLAMLLRVNISTKEISLLTGNNPKSVNMSRYRLRQSLNLNTETDLEEYIQSL